MDRRRFFSLSFVTGIGSLFLHKSSVATEIDPVPAAMKNPDGGWGRTWVCQPVPGIGGVWGSCGGLFKVFDLRHDGAGSEVFCPLCGVKQIRANDNVTRHPLNRAPVYDRNGKPINYGWEGLEHLKRLRALRREQAT